MFKACLSVCITFVLHLHKSLAGDMFNQTEVLLIVNYIVVNIYDHQH